MSLSRVTDAKHFFEELCPRVLETRADAARRLGGSFAFVVEGEGGGTWRIDLAEAGVTAGDADAEVVMRLGIDELRALLKGSLDLDRAVREGRCAIEGDAGRLSLLSIILRP